MYEASRKIEHFFKQGQKVRVKTNLPSQVKSETGSFTHNITHEHKRREGKIITIEECKRSGAVLYYYADGEVWMKDALEPTDTECEVTFVKGGKSLTKVFPTYDLASTFVEELAKKGLTGTIRVKE